MSYSTKSRAMRDLFQPAGHLPDPGPELLGLEGVEVRVVVALLGDPVGDHDLVGDAQVRGGGQGHGVSSFVR